MAAKKASNRHGFKVNEFVIYPSHGVGQIRAVETQEIADMKLELIVIDFIQDKMTLRVPLDKIGSVGMRKLADDITVKKALKTIEGKARVKRTMWSRRAQEYEAKINSGNLLFISEVVRDLYRSEHQPEQSYSERQLYERALERMSRELSSIKKITETETVRLIESHLAKCPQRAAPPVEPEEVAAEVEAAPEAKAETTETKAA